MAITPFIGAFGSKKDRLKDWYIIRVSSGRPRWDIKVNKAWVAGKVLFNNTGRGKSRRCLSGYRVVPASAPGVAAAYSLYGQPKALKRAILFNGRHRILRAGRYIPATGRQQRRNQFLVKLNGQNNQQAQQAHHDVGNFLRHSNMASVVVE